MTRIVASPARASAASCCYLAVGHCRRAREREPAGYPDSEAFHDLLEAQLWVHARDLIMCGQRVIFEKGLWLRSERDEKRREARELGVDIELHYFDVPADELVRRLERRNPEGGPNVFSISRAQTEGYFEIFEPPDETELTLFPESIVHRSGA